ncbi:MAG TPA: ParB/RepB/Spo0J family partition protein [Candidatus Sulfotelmatobacter sp.]|nr:ParB/RepB/Spo0J family partition protein [Candidatus Sulfotelmatobacter sp.]
MTERARRTALGRGLAALLSDDVPAPPVAAADAGESRGPRLVPVGHLHPGRLQPRRRFDPEALEALAASIRHQGVLQPLVVRPLPDRREHFEIVAGERRWRAAQLAQLHEVPVVVRALADRDALEVALIENVQREDLGPIEEAEGYRKLLEQFGYTQDALATAVGKSRSHIANLLRLLTLPASVQEMLQDGRLTAGHARALVGRHDPASLAQQIVTRGLSVREAEALAQHVRIAHAGKSGKGAASRAVRDPDTVALERELSAALGLKVTIDFDGKAGRLVVHYKSLDQLDDVLQRLNQSPRPVH